MDAHHRMMFVLTFGFLLVGIFAWNIQTHPCPEDSFKCDNKRCVPVDRVCDGFADCKDKTDEIQCEGLPNEENPVVVKAANYLLSQRKAESNWDDFTPRALVALSFAEKYFRIPDKESMLNLHNIQLLLILQEGIERIPLHTLALHINTLYAFCENPRDFHGIDLIEILRFRTDKAIGSSDFNKPSVILTLCLAKSSRLEDFDLLLKMYDKKMQTIATKALALIAMKACDRLVATHEYKVRSEEFVKRLEMSSGTMGSYTLGLIIQAFNAWGYKSPLRNELLILQSESGAFTDLLGTYAAIPALLNLSLADVPCSSRNYEAKPAQPTSLQMFSPHKYMEYSVSIPTGENIGRHTLRIPFEGRKSLSQLMEIAAQQNPMFRFSYEQDGYEKKVTSLAGTSNDAESGYSWILYKETADHKPAEMVESGNIERIFPEDAEHYTFQLE